VERLAGKRLSYTAGLLQGGKGDMTLALGALREIVQQGPRSGRGVDATQSAARAILEHVRWAVDCEREDDKPLKELAAILGSPAAALAWMRAKLPQLEAEVMGGSEAVAAAKQLTEGGGNGGR
jgi:hypothetical protein